MKILITGGAGYIGYNLVNHFDALEEVESITVYDNMYRNNYHFFTSGKPLKKTQFIKGDILNLHDLEKAVKDQDVVIHMAAHVDFPYSYKDNYKYEQINQYGTVVLYNLLEKHPPKKVIYLSSAAVYGFRKNITEESEPMPENFYGISKQNAEKYIQLLQKPEVIILRSANVFGYNPVVRLDSVINKLIFESLLYGRIKIMGRGNQLRPFIHMNTLVDEIANFTLGKKGRVEGIYNLVEGNLTLNEIKDFLLSELPDLEFTYLNSNSDFKGLEMLSEKIKYKTNLTQQIKQTLTDFKKAVRVQPKV